MKPPASVLEQFESAGWYPGRQQPLTATIPPGHLAAELLAQFGGLVVGRCGSGIECATSDIHFRMIGQPEPEISIWNELLETTLIGVAEIHHAYGELHVDSSGRFFNVSLIHDAFSLVGSTFEEAVERLLLGRRYRPMLRPDQQSVALYGDEFTADHPGVYRY